MLKTTCLHGKLVVDATYIYCEKCGDFQAQRETFSAYKHRNLVKFLVFVTPDGHIAELFGPYGSF